MRTIEVYKYDELSESSRKVAIESMRSDLATKRIDIYAYEYRRTLNDITKMFGLELRVHSECYQPFYHFDFKNLDEDMENNPQFLLRYLNSEVLPYIDNRKTYYSKDYKKKRTSRIIYPAKYDMCLSGSWCDFAVDDALNHLNDSLLRKESPRSFIDNMLSNFFKQWEKDCEYARSDESIEDDIIDYGDYEFFENGKPYLS